MMEHRIKIVCTFHNVVDYITECIESILRQKYTNWYCILIDNASNDGTYDKLPHNDERFIIHRYDERISPLKCDISAFQYNHHIGDEINVVLCGDDKLLGDYALSTINNIYNDNPNVLLTHGQYIQSSDDSIGSQYPFNEVTFSFIRRLGTCCNNNCGDCTFPYHPQLGNSGFDFNCSHLKTFKSKIFAEMIKQDSEYNFMKIPNSDIWIDNSADVYYMTPLMEIAGLENIYFNEIPLYWWRIHEHNEFNQNNIDKKLYINKMKPFTKFG